MDKNRHMFLQSVFLNTNSTQFLLWEFGIKYFIPKVSDKILELLLTSDFHYLNVTSLHLLTQTKARNLFKEHHIAFKT